ncbi:hypothetical protein AB0C81_26795 [Streptomyces roseoverticillatus]|uniref:hypothetical protein n=1 Tax=Streptomyces roseoverticillatus TaxID=66429 RepID=UPI0033E71277
MTVTPFRPTAQRDDTPDEAPAPIVVLCQRVAELNLPERRCERAEEAALGAVWNADTFVTGSFPNTLATAISPKSWFGYPPVDDPGYAASAATYLGSTDGIRGWWLHYTQRHDWTGEPQHALNLIAPCACGTYFHVEIPDEDALIAMLDELDTVPGTPVDCDYRLRIRSASYADQNHDSFGQPF